MICLPKNVAPILSIASKESGRYTLTGVRVEEKREGHYQVVATDGKRLAIIKGPSARFPDSATPQQPGDTFDYLVEAVTLQASFKDVGKDASRGVFLTCSGDEVILASGASLRRDRVMEGRFPDYGMVIPKKCPRCVVNVNANQLASVLKVAAAIACGPDGTEDARVSILFFGPNEPLGIVAANAAGQTFDGLIMPLHDGSDTPVRTPTKAHEEPEDQEEQEEDE